MSGLNPEQVLALPIADGHPSGARTIRGYLIAPLAALWNHAGPFSPTRRLAIRSLT
jgi:hypothetical protein